MEGKVTPHTPDGPSDTNVETDGMYALNTLLRIRDIRKRFSQKAIGLSNLPWVVHVAICVCVSFQ